MAFTFIETLIAVIITAMLAATITGLLINKRYKALYDEYSGLETSYKDLFYLYWNPKAKEVLEMGMDEAPLEVFKGNIDDYYDKGMITRTEYEFYYQKYLSRGGKEHRNTSEPYVGD